MGARMLGVIFAAIVLNFSSAALEDDKSYEFSWYKESNYNCQSLSGRGTELRIGEDGNAFDTGVTVKFCKDKCAQNDNCQGFDYIDLGGSQPRVCRYKQNIDSDTLTSEATADCYIYGRPSVVELTTPPPAAACADPTGCVASSCDDHIRTSTAKITCASLESLLNCNCDKCLCETANTAAVTTAPPTTSTRPASVTFQFQWSVLNDHDCISGLGTALHIGNDLGPDGKPKGYDTLDLQSCKVKCAGNSDCQGFNYDNTKGVCRYKSSLSQARSIPKDSSDCYVYDRDGSTPVIQAGTRVTMPATTTSTFEYRWLLEKNVDCATALNSQSLAIGATQDGDTRLTYDIASVEECQRTCAAYVNCNGFTYEFELGRCKYKSGISRDISLRAAHHSCYVYERPQNTTSQDTCEEKTSCIRNSCDYHIAHTAGLTCDKLQSLFGCNCNGCECREPPTTTKPRAAPVSFKYDWKQFDDYQCRGSLLLYPEGSNLPIGRDGRAYDYGITPDKCKRVCANNETCMGFNYDPLLRSGTCHYKAALDKAEILKPFPNRSCYVYMAGEIYPERQKTPPTSPPTSCTAPTSCQRVSCDDWMQHNPGVTCDLLESNLGCNCDGCNCRNVVSTTTPSPLPAFWKVMKGHACESNPLASLFIGEGSDKEGRHVAFDKYSLEDCKNKCMRNDDCKGFNYDNALAVCRYKKSLSHARSKVETAQDCWIYDKDGASTIPTATNPVATTTSRTFEYRWTLTEKHDCANENTRELYIGDDRDRSGGRMSYDINTVGYCKRKCANFVKCYGFNYEFVRGTCKYLAGASGTSSRDSDKFNCYVYSRPQTITATERRRPETRPPPRRDGDETRRPARDGGDTRPTRAPEPPTLNLEWKHKENGLCETAASQSLRIGEGGEDFDVQDVASCKRKCERDRQCDGFNYETARNVCKYKSAITISRTRDSSVTDCYVILREKASTPTRPVRPTAATITTSAAPAFSPENWVEMMGYDCASTLFSNLHIGSGFEDDGSTRQTFDRFSPTECKVKCANDAKCRGFNYDNAQGVCHYKKSLDGANAKPDNGHDCYIYDPNGVATTITKGTTFYVPTVPPTTPAPITEPPTNPTAPIATRPPPIATRPPPTASIATRLPVTSAALDTSRTTTPDTQNNIKSLATSGSSGVVVAAVLGTLIALAAVIGAVVGVICFMRKNKDVYVESYHNANNLASGNNDL